MVDPGQYTVRITAAGQTAEKKFTFINSRAFGNSSCRSGVT